MTADRALVAGSLVARQRRTARTGVSYLALSVALDANGKEVRVFAFNTKVIEAVEGLRLGEGVAICGRRWAPGGRDAGAVADGLLTKDGPVMRDKRVAAVDERDAERPSCNAVAGDD